MLKNFKENFYHWIHSNGWVADIGYRTWCWMYNLKEILTPPNPKGQEPNPKNGLYDMLGINISTTAICNSKCIFCTYRLLNEPKEVMSESLFEDIISAWKNFAGPQDRAINLTPGTPPGECLTDPGFERKLEIVAKYGYETFFVTNGILLNKWAKVILNPKNKVQAISISVGSLNPEVYKRTFGVDRGEIVKANILSFLLLNKTLGWPVDVTICFRNAEKPSEIIAHPDYIRLKHYFGPRCRVMFTTWWDDWNGAVPREEMEYGQIKVRKPLNLKRVCQGALLFSMRPGDRRIRFCGCRFVEGQEDQIVGDLDAGGFFTAQENLLEIHNGFKIGKRVKTCIDCGAYKQA